MKEPSLHCSGMNAARHAVTRLPRRLHRRQSPPAGSTAGPPASARPAAPMKTGQAAPAEPGTRDGRAAWAAPAEPGTRDGRAAPKAWDGRAGQVAPREWGHRSAHRTISRSSHRREPARPPRGASCERRPERARHCEKRHSRRPGPQNEEQSRLAGAQPAAMRADGPETPKDDQRVRSGDLPKAAWLDAGRDRPPKMPPACLQGPQRGLKQGRPRPRRNPPG